MAMADAVDIAGMLVATGRAVKPHLWVTSMIEASQAARWDAFASV